MPPTFDVTLPVPLPFALAVTVYWFRVNVAVTEESWVMLNEQSPVPEHSLAEPVPPLQPAKVEPAY